MEKNLVPEVLAEKSETGGRGYLSGIVAVLRQQKSPQGLRVPSGLRTMWIGLDHGDKDQRTIPVFSILRNSTWVEASLSGFRQLALGNTGGLGTVGNSMKTACFGVKAEKPL